MAWFRVKSLVLVVILAGLGLHVEESRADDIDGILEQWQRRSAQRKSLEVRFTREDKTKGGTEHYAGRLILSRAHGAALLVTDEPQLDGRLLPDRLIWTADTLHEIHPFSEVRFVYHIGGKTRVRPPAVFTLPFLWNISVDEVKSRFRFELLKSEQKSWTIAVDPLNEPDLKYFYKALITLKRESFLPSRYYLTVSDDGEDKDTSDYKITETRADAPFPESAFRIPKGDGWKVLHQGRDSILGTTNAVSRFIPLEVVPEFDKPAKPPDSK